MTDSATFAEHGVMAERPTSGGPLTRCLEWLTDLLDNRKVEVAIFTLLFLVLAVFAGFVRPMYPNYDSYYALIWGNEMAHFQLPDYDVFKTPTPHPIFNVYTALLSPLGGATVRVMTVLSLAMYTGLLWGIYRLVKLQIGTLVAFVTLLVVLTRTDLMLYAMRSMLDIPFLLMIVWAAVLEYQKPRRGLAPMLLLAVAGLLRPEAWLMAGFYWLWLAYGWVRDDSKLPGTKPSFKALIGYGFLMLSATVIWLFWDWVVTGDPLYSVNSTSEVAKIVNRQKSLPEAILLMPSYLSLADPIGSGIKDTLGFALSGLAAGAGFLLALWTYRLRMAMLALLAVVGVITYLLIAIGGLSVIPRYLMIPSLVGCFGLAFALVGWERLEGTARKVGIALAVLTVLLAVANVPRYIGKARALNTSMQHVSVAYSRLEEILRKPAVETQLKTCPPINAFTHESVPVIRYELRAPKENVIATTSVDTPPSEGVQLMLTAALNPLQLTGVQQTSRKPWTMYRLPGFGYVDENRAWIAFSSCETTR
jgi:hypothetical protein